LSHVILAISYDRNLKTAGTAEAFVLNTIVMHQRKLEHINELDQMRYQHRLEEEKLQQMSAKKTSINEKIT
jgi:hypothetical protein